LRDFDLDALYAALDAQRQARGLTWSQLGREINRQIESAPVRLISVSTITGMRKRRVIEGDGVLQMLRWLGRAPEEFVPGGAGPVAAPLPVVQQGQILRFDTAAIYARLDERRRAQGLTWAQVAREVGGLGAAGLSRLAKGGRTSFPDIIRIARWLDCTVATLTHISDW